MRAGMTVVERANASLRTKWLCKCRCGYWVIKDGYRLRKGSGWSCGCATSGLISAARRTHGMTGHRLENIRRGMMARCHNSKSKDFPRYGARGIQVISEWRQSASVFYAWALGHGYADDLSIDRLDPTGNYSPENCRWIPLSENVARANRARKKRAWNVAG